MCPPTHTPTAQWEKNCTTEILVMMLLRPEISTTISSPCFLSYIYDFPPQSTVNSQTTLCFLNDRVSKSSVLQASNNLHHVNKSTNKSPCFNLIKKYYGNELSR